MTPVWRTKPLCLVGMWIALCLLVGSGCRNAKMIIVPDKLDVPIS